MKKIIKASITYDTDHNHPDAPSAKGLKYEDVYTMDVDYFSGRDHMDSYIKNDLALVAGGGYNTDHIKNVKFKLVEGAL